MARSFNGRTELERLQSPMRLLTDNKLTSDLAKHPVAHDRSKHIKTKFHLLRDQVSK